jgi:hypothetical protein
MVDGERLPSSQVGTGACRAEGRRFLMGVRSGRVRTFGVLAMALLLVAGGEVGLARGAAAQARDDDQPAAAASGESPAAGEPAPAADPAAADAAPIAPGSGKGFHAVVPARLLDSRTANGGWTGALSAGANQDLVVTNRGGVPASASAG